MNEMRVVMVGKKGVGKSGVGNSLLKKKQFKANTWTGSVTSKCKFGTRTLEDGTNLVIVDTQRILDTTKANTETSKEVVRCIGLSSPGPHAFLFVLKIGARFTQEEKNTIDCFKAIFGEQVMKFVIVIFTGKDNLDEEEITLDEYVRRAPPDLAQLIKDCNGCYAAINNREKNPDEKEKDIQAIFQAVRNTMERNGGEHYTGEMYKAAEERRVIEEERRRNEEEKRRNEEESRKNEEERRRNEEERRRNEEERRRNEEERRRNEEERRRNEEDRRRNEEERRRNEEERRRNEEERRRNEEEREEERRRFEKKLEAERLMRMKEIEEERKAELKRLQEEKKKLEEENDWNKLRKKVQDDTGGDAKVVERAIQKSWKTFHDWFS